MFPGCAASADLCGGLDRAYVTACEIDLPSRSMTLSAHFEKMPAPAELASLSGRLRSDYGLHNVTLAPDFPRPRPAAAAKSGAAASGPGDVLMGRAVRGKTTPMADLTLESGGVSVEGDVFGVTSRALQKRGGAVLCFDMTDRTGSIRVSKYLRADDDQGIVTAVNPGDHLVVQGAITYSRYDEDMIKMLEDMTGVNAREISLSDPDTLSIFTSPKILGLPEDDPIIGRTGTIGIPEFGTGFTRQMLVDTQPTRFDTLVRLSGFSHGTDVWAGNIHDLVVNGVADVNACVGCRDDIM